MKTAAKTFPGFLLILLASAVILPGCGSGREESKTDQPNHDTIYPEARLSPEIKKKLYEIPTPLEIATMLEQAKAGYIFDITNPPENIDRYNTEMQKALNLGIYGADLAYSAIYNRNDETNKFIACTMKLAGEIGIAGVYEEGIIERVRKVGNNKDSLVHLVNRTFIHTNEFLSVHNRNFLGLIIAAGGLAEGLYLSSELCMVATRDNSRIAQVVYRQQENLEKLLTVFEAFKDCREIMVIHDELIKLRPVFTDFGLEKGGKIPRDKVDRLVDLVSSVRNNLVNFH